MSEVLNYYFKKYGLIDYDKEIENVTLENKARHRWDILKKSIDNVSQLTEKCDLTNNKISNDIKFICRINHDNNIDQAMYIPATDSYLTLDDQSIKLFDTNGELKGCISYDDIKTSFKRIQPTNSNDRYIVWSPNTEDLSMLDSRFELIEKVNPDLFCGPITDLLYNEDKNEIISSHSDKLVIWQFRYANRHLMPRIRTSFKIKSNCLTTFAIERTQREFQRLFIANEYNVIVVDMSKGVVIRTHIAVHKKAITALMFFNPLKLLVTGCKDGCIKVWSFLNEDIILKIVFLGHTKSIHHLALFPGGCQATIASCANDATFRVWNLELESEIDHLGLEYNSRSIGSYINNPKFFTLGSNFLDIWNTNQLFDDLILLTNPISSMKFISDNYQNMLIRCRNDLTFFFQPTTDSKVITKTVIGKHEDLMSLNNAVLSVAYLEERNILLVLIQDNRIILYNTKLHPMLIDLIVQVPSQDDLLLLNICKQLPEPLKKCQSKTLVFSGSSKGFIKIHNNLHFDIITYEVEAHVNSSITCILTDSSNKKMFTSGTDNCINVWNIQLSSVELLTKIGSFFCDFLPLHLANIDIYLFVIFNDPGGSQFPSVVYNIQTRGRYDHSPDHNHVEQVNSVSACYKMKLFLSCSSGMENLLKIWTNYNILLRQIEIHSPIHCALFSSNKADIILAIENRLCWVDSRKYLPESFIKKQILMNFESFSSDNDGTIEFNDDFFQNKFDAEDRDKINGIKLIFRYQSYTDILTEDEIEEMSMINETRKRNFDNLKAIESDIANIQEGQYSKLDKRYERFFETPMKSDIFDHYVSGVIKYSKISLPLEEIVKESDYSKVTEKYRESKKGGFFPYHQTLTTEVRATDNIRIGGYIPNSLILQSLWPPKVLEENKADTWKPPKLSSLDIQELSKKFADDNSDEESATYFDWGSDEESEKFIMSPSPTENIPETLSDDILSKFGSLLESKPSLTKESVENFKSSESDITKESLDKPLHGTLSKASSKLSDISNKKSILSDTRKVKFTSFADTNSVSEKLDSEISIAKSQSSINSSVFLTQVPDQENMKKERVSLLPKFLLPFVQNDWFLKICPLPHHENECLKRLPSPLDPNTFTAFLLQSLNYIKDENEILGLVKAINVIYSNESIERKTLFLINDVITNKISETTLDSEVKVALFRTCLQLMSSLEGVLDKSLIIICLSRFFDADFELRKFLKFILYEKGLEDNTDVIDKELANFKLLSIKSGSNRICDLIALVSTWLDKWFQSMMTFASECCEMIGKELHLIGSRGKMTKITSDYLDKVKCIFHLEIVTSNDLKLLSPAEKNPKSILNYINCLNYIRFTKLHSKEKKVMKMESVGQKKTIIALPKLSPDKQYLVRLGEFNSSAGLELKSKRDIISLNAISDHTTHPSMQPFHHYQVSLGGGFVPFLHLHLKPCLVNPFPSPSDYIEWENANPKSFSKCYNRNFFPQFSLPPEPF